MGKQTNIIEVVCQRESLNHGDAFILDAGTAIYVWKGDSCSPFEAQMANMVLSSIQPHNSSPKPQLQPQPLPSPQPSHFSRALSHHCLLGGRGARGDAQRQVDHDRRHRRRLLGGAGRRGRHHLRRGRRGGPARAR